MEGGCSSAASGGRKFRYSRDKSHPPESLSAFLAKKFAYLNEKGWQELIVNGKALLSTVNEHNVDGNATHGDASTATTPHVLVNSSVCVDPFYILQQQDVIGFVAPASLEPEVDEQFTILYEDAHMIAVSKSGNIPVCTGGRYRHNTLERVVHAYLVKRQEAKAQAGRSLDSSVSIYPIHRLDKETSGVTVFAKTKAASQRLALLFASKDDEDVTAVGDSTVASDHDASGSGVLALEISPFAELRVGWRFVPDAPSSCPSPPATLCRGAKRDRPDQDGIDTQLASLRTSFGAGIAQKLRKEYCAWVMADSASAFWAKSLLPLDIRYRIGFAGEALVPSTPLAPAAVGEGCVPSHTHDAQLPLSAKERKRLMWELKNKKAHGEGGAGVRSEMAEGSVGLARGGCSSLSELAVSSPLQGAAASMPSSKFLNSMAMKCYPIDDDMRGKSAHTRVTAIEQLPALPSQAGHNVDILEISCQIFTGRTHQIRCHLAAMGLPILGDKLYSARGRGVSSFDSQCLPAIPLDYPVDEQLFFARCRGTAATATPIEGLEVARHCLHAAKISIPLGVLIALYGCDGGGAFSLDAPVEVLLEKMLDSVIVDDGSAACHPRSDHVERLREFASSPIAGGMAGDYNLHASLILDATSLAKFASALTTVGCPT